MLHLMYLFKPTIKSRANMPAFWHWVAERDAWFYKTLAMAHDRRWYVRTIGTDVHCLEHYVSFENEAAWGEYRAAVSLLSKIEKWEKQRIEQEQWWEILDSRLLNDAPFTSRS